MTTAVARSDDREAFAARPETIGKVKVAAPQTGADYLASLSDGREVYIYGERVKDVTKHQAFRNTARMVARLYDALHDPKRKDKILLPTDTGNGGMTHAFFKAPKTLEETIAGRNAIAEWAKLTYGWMGRAPDYKAAFLATLGANADFYDPYQENARRWYKFSQERVPFINHAIIHPPIDRDKPPNEVGDVCCACREGDRRRHRRVGRQGGGDRLGADQLHLRGAPRAHPGAGQELRHRVHGADQHAGREIHLPHVLRNVGDRDGLAVRLSAVVAARRERRRVHPRQGAGALGERVRLRRRREGQQFLPAHRLSAALRGARLHAACGQARFHRRAAAQGGGGRRHQGLSRRAGQRRRGDRLAQSVLGAVGRHGARSQALDRRLSAAQHGPRQRLRDHRHHRLYARSSTSSSRRWRRG